MFMGTRTPGQNGIGGGKRRMSVAGVALALAAGLTVTTTEAGNSRAAAKAAEPSPPPAMPSPMTETLGLFFDSGPSSDWAPPDSYGASRIPLTQVLGIGASSSNGLHIDIPAVVAYTRSVIERTPGGSRYVMVNDVEGDLNKVYLDTAMAFAAGQAPHPDWEAVVRIHVQLLDALHEAFPGHLFAYYGRPTLPPFVDPLRPNRWDRLSNDDYDRYTAGFVRAYEPIMRASGWLCPQSIYDAYEDGNPAIPGYWGGDHAGAMRASSFNCVRFCRTVFPDKPCVPFCTPYWTNEYYATPFGRIPIDVFMERQVTPCLEAGASGICVYTGLEWVLRMSCSDDPAYERYRQWFRRAYGLPPSESLDWTDPQVRAFLQQRIAAHTMDAIHAVSETLAAVAGPSSAPASAVVPPDPDEVIDKAVDNLKRLPAPRSGNQLPMANYWEELKLKLGERASVDKRRDLPVIRGAIEEAIAEASSDGASDPATGNGYIADEHEVDNLVDHLLARAANEDVEFIPFDVEYFTFMVGRYMIYAKVLERTGRDLIRVRVHSVAAPAGEEGEMSIDGVERVITAKEFDRAVAALASPQQPTPPQVVANSAVSRNTPPR